MALLLTVPLQGQLMHHSDTVKIREVIISSKKSISDPVGYKTTNLDSTVLNNYSQRTVADILSEKTSIVVKSYGTGGIATPSFRGTGAGHTQIAWNGININHPMLGQSDLSLLPAGMIDNIQIFFGGSSMFLNSGGIGGIINLENKPVWKKETVLSLNQGLASFGTYSGMYSLRTGSTRFQAVTKAFFQSSENDFRYLNTEASAIPFRETRQNSQFHQSGFTQELYYRKNRNLLSARLWYQSAGRNIPASMLTQQIGSNEKQFDESFRTMLNYDIVADRFNYYFTGAWVMTRLNYSNRLASIDSRNVSEMLTLKAGVESKIWKDIRLKLQFDEEFNIILSNNYEKSATRNTSSVSGIAEYDGSGRIGAMILLREIADRNKLLLPDFSAGVNFRISDAKDYLLKANFSRNSRIPTMNDLFWLPGGNQGLQNEYSFIYELTYEMKQQISSLITLNYDLTLFSNRIKDMIQWHPGEFSYWTADNIQKVNSSGLESSFLLNFKKGNMASALTAVYSYTRASDESNQPGEGDLSGKQLMYIPENMLNASVHLYYKYFYVFWGSNMTGRRYITVDNSRYLPGYFVNNLTTGIKFPVKRNLFDVNFRIDNLFGVNYQTMAHYPLPGRSYSVKILFQIVKQ